MCLGREVGRDQVMESYELMFNFASFSRKRGGVFAPKLKHHLLCGTFLDPQHRFFIDFSRGVHNHLHITESILTSVEI